MDYFSNSAIQTKVNNPLFQAFGLLIVALVILVSAKLINLTGILKVSTSFPWMTAGAFLLLFAMLNSILSLSAKNTPKYLGKSIYGFIGLAVTLGLLARLFSSISIDEAGSYRWIYIVIAFGYVIFLVIMTLMKKIVEFAQKEEWHQPRRRK